MLLAITAPSLACSLKLDTEEAEPPDLVTGAALAARALSALLNNSSTLNHLDKALDKVLALLALLPVLDTDVLSWSWLAELRIASTSTVAVRA